MIFEGYFIVNTIFSADNVESDTCSGRCLEKGPDTVGQPPSVENHASGMPSLKAQNH